jgi:hypothetical protein
MELINLHVIPGLRAFDPFPFGVLALVVSSESVFLTIFVLISQGRMARQSERRSHLDLLGAERASVLFQSPLQLSAGQATFSHLCETRSNGEAIALLSGPNPG